MDANVSVEPVIGGVDTYDVRPGSWVGIVKAGDRQFHIDPKVGIRRLLYLLSWSLDTRWWREESVEIGDDSTLVDAMAIIYARALDAALARGVVRGYRGESDSGLRVKGRIDIATQVRREHGRASPLHIDFDDHTVDIPANRLLLTAIARLRPLVGRLPQVTRRELARSVARLEGVQVLDLRARRFQRPTITRLNAHYRDALTLADLVLRASSLEATSGERRTSSILFNMNQVFEDFVVRSVRAELGLTERDFPQNAARRPFKLDTGDAISLEPDLSWWEDGRPIFVGDVKYKRINVEGIKHPGIYQVTSYATAAALPEALLVYAAGEATAARHQVRNGGPLIEVTVVDLERDVDGLSEEIHRVAQHVRNQAETGRRALAQRRSSLIA